MGKKIIATVINDLTYDQRMQRICTSLAQAGYDVTLVGRVLPNSQPLKERAFKQKRLKCFFHKGAKFYAEYNIRLFFYLLFTRYDIVNSVDLDTILPGVWVSKLKGKKVVYDAHEYFTEVPEVISRPKVKKAWEKIEKYALPKVDLAYTVSASIAKLFEEKHGVKFDTIRNITVKRDEERVEPDEDKFLIYQGALNKGRGLEEMIDAMTELDCKFKIIGEGDLSDELRKKVSALKLNDKVSFLGYIPPDKLSEHTKKAFAGVNVSQNLGLSYYYSLNNKFFDYMHAGIPSITNKFPEYQLINQQHEIAVLTDADKKTLVDSVNLLLKNPKYYEQLKNNCYHAIDFFNWQNEEQKLIELYESLNS